MTKPRVTDLASAACISKTYASDILNEKQAPSRPLAIRIYRLTGWWSPMVPEMTEEQMAMLEEIEPWTPRKPQELDAA